MRIKSQKDFYAGLMFGVIGAAFAIGATHYNVGTGARMGPGYFPLMVGVLLAIGGVIVMLRALTASTPDGDPIGHIAWRPLALVIGANLVFGALLGGLDMLNLPAMGLVAAIYALVVIASRAGTQFALGSSLLLATVLAIGSYLTFIVGLKLQFQVWPSFITG
ncbi:MAG TPA: tripartite tricarboxylate transporter TctB family protein [Ramlibacter sp.]|nr:tripartite tricarboxylate transporter TctB family protein [Ramlibacter sp.]